MFNVIFFGSSDYCLPILQSLFTNFKPVCVVTKPDQPVGRQKILTPSPVAKFARQYNIPVETPRNKSELLNLKEDFQHFKPDIAIVADYGMIIPIEIFQIPKNQTLNIHFSRLPKLRGASPVQYTILHGEKSSWISVILLDKELDAGDIIWQKEFKLNGGENTEELYKKLFNIASQELPDIIKKYIKKEVKPQQQDHSKATYTRQITRDDGFIPWEILKAAINGKNPQKNLFSKWPLSKLHLNKFSIFNFQFSIERAIHALYPWPGLWTIVKITSTKEKRLKILEAHLGPKTKDQPASPVRLAEALAKRAGGRLKTKLIIDLVQLEGKNPVSWKQFLEGYPAIFSK